MNGTSVPAAATTTTSTTSTAGTRGWSIVVLVTSWSLAALAILLVPFTEPTWHVGQWYGLVDTADAIVFGAVASALLARGRHPVSWLVALCAVGGGLAALSLQWSMLVMVHPDLPELPFLQSAQNWAWVPGTYAMIILVPVLVRRRPMATIERAFVVIGAAAITGLTLMRLTDPYPWPDGPTSTPLVIRSTWWIDVLDRTVADAVPHRVCARRDRDGRPRVAVGEADPAAATRARVARRGQRADDGHVHAARAAASRGLPTSRSG